MSQLKYYNTETEQWEPAIVGAQGPQGEQGPTGPQGPEGPPGETYPDQTDNAGKFLTTDGTDVSWETVNALPDQTDNGGKYLTTDGTDASWAFISGGSATDEPPASPQDGTLWLDTDGTIYPTSVEIRRWTKTVSSSITEFTGAGDETEDLAYEPGTEQVYLNGVALIRGTDYTASSGTSITLATAAVSGDILQVILLPPVEVANVINNNIFDAKGDIITATADNTPINLAVGANGTFLKADDSTPSGLVWAPVDVAAIEDNYVLTLMGAI